LLYRHVPVKHWFDKLLKLCCGDLLCFPWLIGLRDMCRWKLRLGRLCRLHELRVRHLLLHNGIQLMLELRHGNLCIDHWSFCLLELPHRHVPIKYQPELVHELWHWYVLCDGWAQCRDDLSRWLLLRDDWPLVDD